MWTVLHATQGINEGTHQMQRFQASVVATLCLLVGGLGLHIPATAQPPTPAPSADAAGDVVAGLYELVTFGPGETPDWEKVKASFIEEAVIVLRTSREASTVFSVDGFIADFVKFNEREDVRQSGFSERVVRTKSMIFGDIAHVLVLYEASIPGSARPPQQGVDSFQLMRKSGRWRIVSIVNEVPTADRPVPAVLRG